MVSQYEFDESVLKAMVELEGFTYEEAKLTYAARQKLPDSAFCGPKRTYPAHDAPRVGNAIVRLFTFKPKGWRKILRCVCRRAKKFGVESEKCGKVKKQESKIVEWFRELNK